MSKYALDSYTFPSAWAKWELLLILVYILNRFQSSFVSNVRLGENLSQLLSEMQLWSLVLVQRWTQLAEQREGGVGIRGGWVSLGNDPCAAVGRNQTGEHSALTAWALTARGDKPNGGWRREVGEVLGVGRVGYRCPLSLSSSSLTNCLISLGGICLI